MTDGNTVLWYINVDMWWGVVSVRSVLVRGAVQPAVLPRILNLLPRYEYTYDY